MFVRNLATQASWLQQQHYNSAHESRSGNAFMCEIMMLSLYPAGLHSQVAHKHNWGTSLSSSCTCELSCTSCWGSLPGWNQRSRSVWSGTRTMSGKQQRIPPSWNCTCRMNDWVYIILDFFLNYHFWSLILLTRFTSGIQSLVAHSWLLWICFKGRF